MPIAQVNDVELNYRLEGDGEVRGEIVVGADGVNSLVRRSLGDRSEPRFHEEIAMDSPGPERQAMNGELRHILEKRIDALPDLYRAVFVLRAVEELSVEETSAALGLTEATVRTRFFRARALLRATLANDMDFAMEEVFGFAGERCDRIVARVLAAFAAPK